MSRYRIAVFFQMLMAITCLLSGVYARPGQQEPGQPLRLKSELVQFEVRVTDKFGRPVMGLNKNDFSLTEKGKTQDISFFSVVDLTGGSRNRAAPRGDSVSGSTGWEKSSGRTIFIILDPYFIHRTRYWAVDRSLTRLIDEDLSPGDRVGIFSTNGKLAGFQQTTGNKTILLTAIHAFFGKADRLAAEVDPELASAQEDLKLASEPIDAHDISERRQDSLRGFISALKTGRDVPGPKVAIFISESSSVTVISSSPFSRLGSLFTELHKVTQESLDRGMSVFTIDPRGFGPDADAASDERDGTSRRQEGLLGTREDPSEPATSGSEFRVLDDVDCGCLQKALSLNSFYYRLAYYPPDPSDKERFRKVNIQVKGRPNLKVYASGFLWTEDQRHLKLGEGPRRKEVSKAVASIAPIHDLEVAITHAGVATEEGAGTRSARMEISIDPSELELQTEAADHLASFEVYGSAFDVNERLVGSYTKDYELRLSPGDFQKVMNQGINLSGEIPLKTRGLYNLKVVVVDKQTNRLGSAADWVQAR